MSNNEHPITPPDELVKQWQASLDCPDNSCAQAKYIATQAANWGADQELEACCALMDDWGLDEADLRAARRPKPPSLKKQALKVLFEADGADHPVPMLVLSPKDAAVIRRALEALPE